MLFVISHTHTQPMTVSGSMTSKKIYSLCLRSRIIIYSEIIWLYFQNLNWNCVVWTTDIALLWLLMLDLIDPYLPLTFHVYINNRKACKTALIKLNNSPLRKASAFLNPRLCVHFCKKIALHLDPQLQIITISLFDNAFQIPYCYLEMDRGEIRQYYSVSTDLLWGWKWIMIALSKITAFPESSSC